ncbi:prolyl oligopeptidase family serine peptidase [Endozoicomonadaceae bacterium StTr2]
MPFVDDNGDIYTYTERYIYHFVNTDQGDIQCTGYNLPANEISDCIFTTQVVSEKYIVAVSRAELDLSSCPNACLHVFDREHQTARTINLGQHFINFVDLTDDTLVTSLCHDNGSLIQRYQLAGGADDNTGFYPMVSSLMIKGLNIRWGGVLDSGWWLAGEQFDTLKAGVVMLDDSAANIRICAVSPTDSYGLEGASLKDGDVLLSYSSCNRVLTERFHISECCASGLFTIEKQNEKPRLRQVLTAKSGDVSVPVCLSGTPDTMALPEFILLDVYAFYGCDECEAGDVGSSQLFRSILNSGGLYAMAYVRGSGHFGPGWAESGDWLHKQNSVDDLLSTAKMLKARYPDVPIVAMSGSAGGFIVGAALNAACGTALLDAALLMKPVVNSRDFETDIIDVCKISGATQYGESVLVSLGGLCPTANMQPGEYPPTLLVLGSRDYLINKTSAATWTEKLRENDTRNTERHYVYMHSDTHTTALCAGSKDASLAVINGFIRNCVLKISSKSVAQ